jgi:hypothetical protein
MASAIRFTEVINNNGTALTGNALRETAISSDDFKWAYAGSGANRYVEFYDAQIGADRVATITTGSYGTLTSASGTLAQVTSTVSGIGKYDAPVTGVSTATGAFIINMEHIAVAYLTAAGSSNVQYVFKNKCFEFAINRTPTQIYNLSTSLGANSVKTMSAGFPVFFFSGNRILNNAFATGTSGCIFAFSKLKSAGVIADDRRFIDAGVTGVVSEIYLDTPDSLVLATTTPLSTIIPIV